MFGKNRHRVDDYIQHYLPMQPTKTKLPKYIIPDILFTIISSTFGRRFQLDWNNRKVQSNPCYLSAWIEWLDDRLL